MAYRALTAAIAAADYCGVISCRIEATRDWIEWHDIALEDDSGPQSCADNTQKHPQLTLLPRLRFEKHAYRQELERLLSIAGETAAEPPCPVCSQSFQRLQTMHAWRNGPDAHRLPAVIPMTAFAIVVATFQRQ